MGFLIVTVKKGAYWRNHVYEGDTLVKISDGDGWKFAYFEFDTKQFTKIPTSLGNSILKMWERKNPKCTKLDEKCACEPITCTNDTHLSQWVNGCQGIGYAESKTYCTIGDHRLLNSSGVSSCPKCGGLTYDWCADMGYGRDPDEAA